MHANLPCTKVVIVYMKMAAQAHYNDNDYKNWIRTCLGLQVLKEGIVGHVDTEVQHLHRDILTNVCQSVTCNSCSTDDITKRRQPCPNNVCDKIYHKIKAVHRDPGTPHWQNTDATKWCSSHWEIAKCFMPKGYKTVTSSADTDTTGILNVCINWKFMHLAVGIIPPVDIFHKNRAARNAVLHSGSMSLSDVERNDYIQDMVTLLTSYKQPIDNVTQDAIHKLRQLNRGIFITPTDELTALKEKLDTIDISQMDIGSKVDTVQQVQERMEISQRDIQHRQEQADNSHQELQNKVETVQHKQDKVDVSQRGLESKLDIVQQKQDQVDVSQRGLESKLDIVQQKQDQADVSQRGLESKLDIVQQKQDQVDVSQRGLESKLDIVQQKQDQADVSQRGLESKLDVVQQKQDQVDVSQRGLERELDIVQQKQDQVDVSQRGLESKLDVVQQKQDQVDVSQRGLERELDTVQQKQDQVDVSQRKLESKVVAIQEEQERIDITAIKEEIEMNGESLVVVKEKLDAFQKSFSDSMPEIHEKCKTLQDRTDTLQKYIIDLSACVESTESKMKDQESRIDQVKDQTSSHEIRIDQLEDVQGKNKAMICQLNDELGEQKTVLHTLVDKTGYQDTRMIQLKDESKKNTAQMKKLEDQVENQSSVTDQLKVETAYDKVQMDVLTVQAGTQVSRIDQMKCEVDNHTSDIHDLVLKTGDQETRMIQLRDQLGNKVIQVKELRNQTENQESRIDQLEMEGRNQTSKIADCIDQSIDQESKTSQLQDDMEDQKSLVYKLVDKTDNHDARLDILQGQLVNQESQESQIDQLVYQTNDQEYRICGVEDKTRHLEEKFSAVQKQDTNAIKDSDDAGSALESLHRKVTIQDQWKKDIQKYLIAKYQEDISSIPVSPILQRVKTTIDHVYTKLLIRDDLVHKDKHPKPVWNPDTVESYQAIFNDDNKPCRKIYVVGNAGIGKTTWSRKLVGAWTDAIQQYSSNNIPSSDEIELQKFDLVFYIELRHAKADSHISEMMEHQLFRHQPELMTKVKTLMESDEDSSRCLIVLDGLDEWVSRNHSSTRDGLPARDPRWRSTVITTTRSWKLEELQMEQRKIDRAIEIRGLQEADTMRLVDEVVSALNASTGNNKTPKEFKDQCHESMSKCLQVPLMLTFFVCLWYEEGQIDELLAGTFCGLVELLIKYTEGDVRKGLYQKIPSEKLAEMKGKWGEENSWIPNCFAKKQLCELYSPFLIRLGKMAFDHLFSNTRESTLVFDYQSIRNLISEEELEVALNTGILSQTMRRGSVLEQEFCLSFLHKTVQEFLAALYMASDRSKQCLNTYSEYCTDVYKVLEMENILILVSGLCPEVAGEMTHHIASMERNQSVHKLLLRCMRQEYTVSNTVRHIYIKHLFLYYDSQKEDDNMATAFYLKMAKDVDTTLNVGFVNAKAWRSIVDIRNVRLVEANIDCSSLYGVDLQFSNCLNAKSNRDPADNLCLPSEHLAKIHVNNYRRTTVLDLSGCNKLRTLSYIESTAPIRLPSEQLEEIEISNFYIFDSLEKEDITNDQPSEDSVICTSLEEMIYELSKMVPESLEKEEQTKHQPSEDWVLDMTRCTSLKAISYESSNVPIRLPLEHMEHLEKVEIISYEPDEDSALDLSGCQSLRQMCYKWSKGPIRLPLQHLEHLEKLELTEYTSEEDSTLDLSECKYLRTICYKQSTVPIQLSNDHLEYVLITGYTPNNGSDLDMSACTSLKTVFYAKSTAPIRLSAEHMSEIVVIDYKPSDEAALDLSESKMLRTLCYWKSRAPLHLFPEHLQKVDIRDYKPIDESELDLSGCKYLKTLCYKQTTAPIRLPFEQLEKVEIVEYTPSREAVLDMSGCTALRTVDYRLSTAPILLPSEKLQNVKIIDYKPSRQFVLDLDMSGCESLKTLCFEQSTVPIKLPTEHLEEVEIRDYQPNTISVLDMSECKTLKTLTYMNSSVPIRVPSEHLEKIEIKDYKPNIEPVLDMSRCKSLSTLSYIQSTASILLPSEKLWMVKLASYAPGKVTVLDMSGCEALTSLDYTMSSVPIKLPNKVVYGLTTDSSTANLLLDREFDRLLN